LDARAGQAEPAHAAASWHNRRDQRNATKHSQDMPADTEWHRSHKLCRLGRARSQACRERASTARSSLLVLHTVHAASRQSCWFSMLHGPRLLARRQPRAAGPGVTHTSAQLSCKSCQQFHTSTCYIMILISCCCCHVETTVALNHTKSSKQPAAQALLLLLPLLLLLLLMWIHAAA
jgi:hypothetical protein